MNDGSYRIYSDGQWKPLTNNNGNSNNLANDRHYRYENGYHYYVLDNGDYYYYQDGKWIFVSNSTETPAEPSTSTEPTNPATPTEPTEPEQPAQPSEPEVPAPTPAEPTPEQPAPSDKPEEPTNPSDENPTLPSDLELPENPPFVDDNGDFNPFNPTTPEEPKPEEPSTDDKPAVPGNSGLVTIDEPSESLIPAYTDKPAEGLEHPDWAPNGQTPKLVYPPGKPGSAALKNDPNYYTDGTTHYYYVPSNSERTGYPAYWKWMAGAWKLQGMTDPNDPALDPKLHENTDDDEYMYSDKDSNFKLFSTNLVATGQAGQPLPFQNVEEFKNYVIERMNPKFVDNSGWDAKVEWKIDDEDLFEQSKQNPWAKDYIITANLTSGVSDKNYKGRELGYVKFVYRVEATDATNYIDLNKAKEAFAKINEERKANGLKELTWSDEIYNSQALPKVNSNSRQYNSEGIVFRREEDPAVVAKKWLNSGLRELLLDEEATEGAVAAVVNGNGDYFWAFNYK